jgi:hypothetical protein
MQRKIKAENVKKAAKVKQMKQEPNSAFPI